MSRRAFVAGMAGGAVSACVAPPNPGSQVPPALVSGAGASAGIPVNPLVRQRADAQIFRHEDGPYYMTASVPEYDRLVIRRAATIAGLASAEERVIWRRPVQGRLGGHIWAPELHHFGGQWHIYFAAGDFGDVFRIRTYVLANSARDPFDAGWRLLGELETPWDSFNLDSTVFMHKGTRYLAWAQGEPGIETNSNLYLAPLATATTLARRPVRLTVPVLPWEIQGFKVAEGPALLNRNGRLFLTYSASATDARYALGLLAAHEDADIMSPEAWTKSPVPVFKSSPITGVYGPGHNSFTVDEQGRDILVHHGRDYERIEGDPLYDPNRHTRVQRIYYRPDGTPDFGVPVGSGPVPDRFSPADQSGAYLLAEQGAVTVGEGSLPLSQIRRKPGLAGSGSVSLEPILAPGKFLVRGADGSLAVAANDGTAEFARRSSFRQADGLADPRGVSLAALDAAGDYIRHANGIARVGPVRSAAELASATFLVS